MTRVNHTMVPAVYLVMRNSEGKILGLYRTHTGYMDGYWTLPSGHVEKDELPLKGMVRETLEEVGISVDPNKLDFVQLMVRPEETAGERVDIFFETTDWDGEVVNTEPEKHGKVEWVNEDSVEWMPYQKQALSLIEKGIKYSEWKVSHD